MKSIAVIVSLVACAVALPAPQLSGSGYTDPYGAQLPTFSNLNTNPTSSYYNGYAGNQMRIYPYVIGPYAYPYYQYYTNSNANNGYNGYTYGYTGYDNGLYNAYNGYNTNNRLPG